MSLLAEYHDLASGGPPRGRDRPERVRLIEDLLLEGHRLADGAHVAQLELHRPAQIASGCCEVVGATLAVAIDDVEVALAAQGRRQLKLQAPVVLSIQACWPKVWWTFLGRITRVHSQGRTVTVHLLRTLGCMAGATLSLQAAMGSGDLRRAPGAPSLATLGALPT